jgi:5-methylcytosine-specific restriction endonuclease McrA
MGRTLRSGRLRSLLWLEAKGKCRGCGRDLPHDWHADHIVPFRVSQRTNVHEMQALCPACNLAKGDRSCQIASSVRIG